MGKNTKLLPSQIEKIQNKIQKLKNERKQLIESMKDDLNGFVFSQQDTSGTPASGIKAEYDLIEKRIQELEELLKNAELLVSYDENKIDIGTHFTATLDFDGEIETDEYILVETRDVKGNDAIYITKDSPMGNVVFGKSIGDTFNYKLPTMTVVGFIEDIIPKEELGKQKVK
jgi:transcription elongation GreA/GreB family factor